MCSSFIWLAGWVDSVIWNHSIVHSVAPDGGMVGMASILLCHMSPKVKLSTASGNTNKCMAIAVI